MIFLLQSVSKSFFKNSFSDLRTTLPLDNIILICYSTFRYLKLSLSLVINNVFTHHPMWPADSAPNRPCSLLKWQLFVRYFDSSTRLVEHVRPQWNCCDQQPNKWHNNRADHNWIGNHQAIKWWAAKKRRCRANSRKRSGRDTWK